jgi:hypothetical protein
MPPTWQGGPNQAAELGQIRVPKSASTTPRSPFSSVSFWVPQGHLQPPGTDGAADRGYRYVDQTQIVKLCGRHG